MSAVDAAPVPAAGPRSLEWDEISKHNKRDDLWMVIDGKVYDTTRFLDEHPGGEEVMVEVGGQDATEAFEEIGHSDDARDLLKGFYVGDLSAKAKLGKAATKIASSVSSKAEVAKTKANSSGFSFFPLVPLVAIVAFAVYKLLESN
ncbi:cytochrome b5-like heme/steroid binding domain-containing protein [Geranomyces variabilis]|nr:cytochrome b5-like heme/steroid binding domain-containing protein [Geranomyces variabilis]KAJ3142376.1 Cytochrome b5 [Geranomyces variabilis]